MVEILAALNPEGYWEACTQEPPFMYVRGDTRDIVVGIVERNLVWYEERQSLRRQREMIEDLNRVVLLPPPEVSETSEDTAPSELSGC